MATIDLLKGKELNETEFIYQICQEHDCSIRTAREYLKIGRIKHGQLKQRTERETQRETT